MDVPSRPDTDVRRGPVLFAILLLLAGVSLGLAAVDAAVGWFDRTRDLTDQELHVRHDQLVWTLRPQFQNDKTRINSHGLRSPEIPAQVPPDEVRVLGVGASRCYGAGKGNPPMDLAWSQQLENHLKEQCPGNWRVLNGGVMGYSAVQAARRAILLIDEVQPDLIVVFISPGRQLLLDPSDARKWVHVGEHLVPAEIAGRWPRFLLPAVDAAHGLLQRSAIYRRYQAMTNLEGRIQERYREYVISRAEPPPAVAEMLDRTLAELAALARIAAGRGIEVRALLLLEPYQDRDDRWQSWLQRNASHGAPPLGTARFEPLMVLQERIEAAGVPCWPLLEEMGLIGRNRERFTCDGAHWSAAGHDLIARGMLRSMRHEGLHKRLQDARAARPRR